MIGMNGEYIPDCEEGEQLKATFFVYVEKNSIIEVKNQLIY